MKILFLFPCLLTGLPAHATTPDMLADDTKERPAISIVIDDMGVDAKRSLRAVDNLPAPVALSYLAYAPRVKAQVDGAKSKGHEICLHLPWEPKNGKADPGPHALTSDMSEEKLQKALKTNLDAFAGYDCVNNHMGSKLSRDHDKLAIIMKALKERNVAFLDSRTVPGSLAEKTARAHGVATTHRDVFIDHHEKPENIASALAEVETIALERGLAIAIGHPKDTTLAHLEAWLPSLERKGFRLVTLSEAIALRQQKQSDNLAKGEMRK